LKIVFAFFGIVLTFTTISSQSLSSDQNKPAAQNNTKTDPKEIKPIDEVWRVVFHNAKGKDIVLDVEVARTPRDKERGLMFRKSLPKNRGMIFVYDKPEEMSFWMQNTFIPLSIAYIHEKKFISSIHDMKPLSLDIISSEVPALYAIEVNMGWFKNNFILTGNQLTIYKNPQDYKIEKKNKYRQEIPNP